MGVVRSLSQDKYKHCCLIAGQQCHHYTCCLNKCSKGAGAAAVHCNAAAFKPHQQAGTGKEISRKKHSQANASDTDTCQDSKSSQTADRGKAELHAALHKSDFAMSQKCIDTEQIWTESADGLAQLAVIE